MNIDQYKEAIKICRKAKIPLMAWGPGGVGKSQGFFQAAKEENIPAYELRGPLLDPVDISGYPEKHNEKMIWLRPEELPDSGEGMILIDELPDIEIRMVKNALYQILLDHKCKTHIIPDSIYIMGAGNRPEDSIFSQPLPQPLITRMCHIGVACDAPDFTKELPEKADVDFDSYISHFTLEFHSIIPAFTKLYPDCIYKHQAVPRTWEFISKFLNSQIQEKWFDFAFKECIKGTIGANVGIAFNAFLSLATKIPSIDAILNNPDSVQVPEFDYGILYAVTTALLARLKTPKGQAKVDNIVKFVAIFPEEFTMFFFSLAGKIYPAIVASPEYIKIKNRNPHLL